MAKGRPRKPGKREPNGRIKRNPSAHGQAEMENMQVVLTKRCQLMGWGANEATMRIVKGEQYGCNAGRWCAKTFPDKPELWEAVKYIRATTIRYLRAIGAPMPFPKCMSLQTQKDRIDATGGPAPDLTLTDEERVRRATAAYMAMLGWLGAAGPHAAQEARRVVVEDGQVVDGWQLLVGLKAVAMGVEGKHP